jgi:hypothetical protein
VQIEGIETPMINAAETKAILRILVGALPDEGGDLLTSIQIEQGSDGQLEVSLQTRDFEAISRLMTLDGIEDQIMQATHRQGMFFSLEEVTSDYVVGD